MSGNGGRRRGRFARFAGAVSLLLLLYRMVGRPSGRREPPAAAPEPPGAPPPPAADPGAVEQRPVVAAADAQPERDAPASGGPPPVDPAPSRPAVTRAPRSRRPPMRLVIGIIVATVVITGGAMLFADERPGADVTSPTGTAPGAADPPEPAVPLGVYIGPGDRAGFEAFATWLGRRPVIASEGLEELRWDAIVDPWWLLDAWANRDVGLAYSLVMLPRDEGGTLEQGAAGEYDQYFRQLAERLVAGGQGDAILRPGWEFSGDWQPWSARRDPQAFTAYYRRIVETMRAVPGADFTFVWNPAIGPIDPDPWPAERAWPGADVVDAIGLDVYDVCYIDDTYPIPADATGAEARVRHQRCWNELLTGDHGLDWYARFAARMDKPLVVPEWGLVPREYPGGGDNPVFIQGMYDWALANDVQWMVYFNKEKSELGNHRIDDGTYPWSGRLFRSLFGIPPAG